MAHSQGDAEDRDKIRRKAAEEKRRKAAEEAADQLWTDVEDMARAVGAALEGPHWDGACWRSWAGIVCVCFWAGLQARCTASRSPPERAAASRFPLTSSLNLSPPLTPSLFSPSPRSPCHGRRATRWMRLWRSSPRRGWRRGRCERW